MTFKIYEKFEKELTCWFKIHITNLAKFDWSTLKPQNLFPLMGCF